jgi:mRNA-degrading endonuclease RelE of RelBE toxin-antitoxin system
MSYRVFWSPQAEEQIERLASAASEPSRVATAARLIDSQLAKDPIEFGESRYDAVRVAFKRPLGIQYEVLEDVKTVVVYSVWRIDMK